MIPALVAAAAFASPPDAVHRGDCALCHAVPGVAEPPRTASCVTCHQWVLRVAADPVSRAKAMAVFPKWARYEKSVRSYLAVPDLGVAAARLDPAWVAAYLRDPHDLRPGMPETMPRLGLSDADVGAIAAWVGEENATAPPSPAPDPANVARGEALFGARGCGACHTFGERATGPGIATAPDLRHARDRMSDDMIVAWIVDPRAVAPGATMPATGLSREEAVAVRDFLVLAEPGGRAPAPPSPVTAADRPVAWADVEERVFGRICVHCHMDPAKNEGRAGPGNAGGFGWPATGIELQTYEGAKAHGDAVIAALLRRRGEAARDVVAPGEAPLPIDRPALPGMPLGLPPIPDEDLALVLAWYAQGCAP